MGFWGDAGSIAEGGGVGSGGGESLSERMRWTAPIFGGAPSAPQVALG
jgi:hypothetical protein